MAVRAALVGVVVLVLLAIGLEACDGTSHTDKRRVEQLADEPVFDRLDVLWEPSGERRIKAAYRVTVETGLNEVSQFYDAGDVNDPLAEALEVLSIMEQEGWTDFRARCEGPTSNGLTFDHDASATVSGQRLDEHETIFLAVTLYAPGVFPVHDLTSTWVGRAELQAGFVDEADGRWHPRGEEVRCLHR